MKSVEALGALAAFMSISIALGLGVLAFVGHKSGYSLAVMDWNSNGITTPSEIFASLDIGSRTAGGCTEYFSYKDGLPIKKICGTAHT